MKRSVGRFEIFCAKTEFGDVASGKSEDEAAKAANTIPNT
jgi:hypothetical protein